MGSGKDYYNDPLSTKYDKVGTIPSGPTGWIVVFNGFRTKEQTQAFAGWYSNSGEQDACCSIWDSADSKRIDVHDRAQAVHVELEIIEKEQE